MSTDVKLEAARYPDEIWAISVDWTDALAVNDDTLSGAVTCEVIPDGSFTAAVTDQDGNITRVLISGGTDANLSARIAFTAPIEAGQVLGFNLGTPIRRR